MSFGQSIKHVFKNYAKFRGRANRSEFWWFSLFMTIVYAALFVISEVGVAISADPQLWSPLANVGIISGFVWFLATILPVSAVWFRRLHDSNKPGWWFVLTLAIGVVGWVLLVLSALQNVVFFAAGFVLILAAGVGSLFLLILALLPSNPGPNRFGAGPADSPEEHHHLAEN